MEDTTSHSQKNTSPNPWNPIYTYILILVAGITLGWLVKAPVVRVETRVDERTVTVESPFWQERYQAEVNRRNVIENSLRGQIADLQTKLSKCIPIRNL